MAKQKKVTAWCDRRLIISPYYFALCLTEKAFQKELRHLKVPKNRRPEFMGSPSAEATTHYFQRGNKHSAIVCIKATHKHTAIAVAGTLVHEAVHIWQAIKDVIGEQKPSSEFEAYSIQMISQELFRRFAELGEKFK